MKLMVFDGTAEEFSVAAPALRNTFGGALRGGGIAEEQPNETEEQPKAAEKWRCITPEEAREVMIRLELSKPMRKVLIALRDAGDKRLSSGDLHKVTGQNADQFRGMMGAFGRRLVNTVGKNVWFFNKKWDTATGQYSWSLPPSVIQAMGAMGIQ